MTSISAYGAAKYVNAKFVELKIEKVLPAQMMYNYTTARVNKGLKSFIELNENNEITIDSLERWIAKYLKKNFNVDYVPVNENEPSLF
jgi:hypothetical protein